MLAARALVIQRWKFRKLHIFRRQIALCIHGQFAHPVSAILVHSDDFAVAHVGYGVRRFYQLERLSCWTIEVKIVRHIERVPDCLVFAAEPIERESARLLIAHRAYLVKESDGVEEPDTMFCLLIMEIKIRTVTWLLHLDAFDFRILGAAHRFGKTNQLGLLTANRPVIPVAANCDDPLFGVRAIQEDMQPTFKPRTGG